MSVSRLLSAATKKTIQHCLRGVWIQTCCQTPQRRWISGNADPRRAQVYHQEPDLEDFENYATGGYHPTVVGDTFHNDRYEVVHKLGFGGYSLVWLAQDKKLNRYVALKMLVADESQASNESIVLKMLSTDKATHPGQQFVRRQLDEFVFDGPNGRHLCLVLDPAACSVRESKECSATMLFPVEAARSIAAQLIMGTSYLHSKGICHGG